MIKIGTTKDVTLISIILCLFFVHVIHGIYDAFINFLFYLALIFVTSWVLMIFYPIDLVRYFVLELPIIWPIRLPYLICCILAWISLFVLIKYTKGMKLVPRIVYLYLIPALVMSLVYLYHLPIH